MQRLKANESGYISYILSVRLQSTLPGGIVKIEMETEVRSWKGRKKGTKCSSYSRAVRLSLSYDLLEPRPVVSDLFHFHSQQTSLKRAVGEKSKREVERQEGRTRVLSLGSDFDRRLFSKVAVRTEI